ncbi:hypothetical protein [Haladaptatus sp. DFWS20]|uniref:hypothetical protein n=1 Tax=Haladaptatus sp. DFWS20 TaxID=3403467 RepID=UPI003EBFDCD1
MERRPVRVLHVQDNEFFGKVASDVLHEELDYVEVHTENAPRDALARLKEEQSVLIEGRETALQHGSGLGLWLTNWVVGKFGGELTFGTNQPRGSVVTIRLQQAEPPSS